MVWERLLRAAYRQSALSRWALALLFLGLATAVRFALRPVLQGEPFITFVPAIIGAAVLCGPAQAATILIGSAAIAWAAFMPSFWRGPFPAAEKPFAAALYLAVSVFIIILVTALLDAMRANHRLVRQQETLFRELQHRVANSLQFIASMLVLARQQAAQGHDAAAVLDDAAARIEATGKLHRRMHDTAQLARGLDPLLRDILDDLFADVTVAVHIDAGGVSLPLSQMTPAVLLVTEIATNALKHVFRPGLGRRFSVTLAPSGDVLDLTIRDDGPGLGAALAGQGSRPGAGLGMQIMHSLAHQLGGRLDLADQDGLVVRVRFRPA
jgi:two-component sensor histidine kinase